MPFSLQAKILRATEEKVITRVGDTTPVYTNFRIISATNQDIEQRVEQKQFRLDLLHRLNTLQIHIPPLRERAEDIQPLLVHFVGYYATKFNKPNIRISNEVFEALQRYDFPGNVRELRNMTERAVILCKGSLLGVDDFPVKTRKSEAGAPVEEMVNLKNNELMMIRKALASCQYNQSAAADMLGITRDALIRKMKKYDISVGKGEE
jgi:DNA-binding NtrC family response regulator